MIKASYKHIGERVVITRNLQESTENTFSTVIFSWVDRERKPSSLGVSGLVQVI